MYCYNCGQQVDTDDRFCRFCGTALNVPPAPKKGSRWVPILSMILLFATGLALFFAFPYNTTAPAVPVNTDYFTINDGVLSFDESRYTGSSDLVIPREIDGQTVRSLADGCFDGCKSLTSVELPDTLETIGKHAFRDCTALRGMEIPDSVTRIGVEAFYGCTALEAICLGDDLEYVGIGAFKECNQLYYIMFLGEYQDWVELYDEFITPYTGVFCDDGSFYQGKPAE